MNGPHGLWSLNLDRGEKGDVLRPPFEVIERLGAPQDGDEGLRTVYLSIVDQTNDKGTRNVLADAFCDFVEFDYATRDAAAQWMLDMCNVKYGG